MAHTTSLISAIVAMSENRVIGRNNQLPWHLPADLKHFKMMTTGHAIIMGRKTFDSIGKPLPNRTNIIITRNRSFTVPGCIITTSIDEAIQKAVDESSKEIFIIGGTDIFIQSMPHISRLYLTIVHDSFEGDVFFPELNMNEWKEIESILHKADYENKYSYSFLTLERIKNC